MTRCKTSWSIAPPPELPLYQPHCHPKEQPHGGLALFGVCDSCARDNHKALRLREFETWDTILKGICDINTAMTEILIDNKEQTIKY
jgi:hypothetical protein